MRVFRGPSSVPFPDSSHELVSTSDLATTGTFQNGAIVFCANVTKEPNERQALAHIEMSAADVLTLHNKLLNELTARSRELDKLRLSVAKAKQHIYDIYEAIKVLDDDVLYPEKRQELLDFTDFPLECLECLETAETRRQCLGDA